MTKSKTRTGPTSQSVYIPGVDFATACSGTKYKNRDDLLMIALDPGSHVCGCFTVSTMPSAPVIWSKNNNEKNSNIKQRSIFLVNAGNANAFTGEEGLLACEKKQPLCQRYLIVKKNIFFASTGVIGNNSPIKK